MNLGQFHLNTQLAKAVLGRYWGTIGVLLGRYWGAIRALLGRYWMPEAYQGQLTSPNDLLEKHLVHHTFYRELYPEYPTEPVKQKDCSAK